MSNRKDFKLRETVYQWEHLGMVIERGRDGGYDSSVTGDPCIVWDEKPGVWRMFYFAQRHEGDDEVNCIAQAVSKSADEVGPGKWTKLGPIKYSNPEALIGNEHKPWILMDAYKPNYPVKLDSRFILYFVSFRGMNKVIQAAESESLEGPWEVKSEPVIDVGDKDSFEGYHVDTVSAFYFGNRQEILIIYKGYPQTLQKDRVLSPYGSCTAAAVMMPGDKRAEKLGRILSPSNTPGHWTAGWTSGMQIFPAEKGGWYALMTASPNPPVPIEEEASMREPAPSLGGWAYTSEDWPVGGWKVEDGPIVRIEELPKSAVQEGEGVNLWRHHILVHPDGHLYLYYNSGRYGQERMFLRKSIKIN